MIDAAVPGAQLSRAYEERLVHPLLERHRPGPAAVPARRCSRADWERLVHRWLERRGAGLAVAAARLGSGSGVLGFDDLQSRGRDWGLRLTRLGGHGRAEEVDAMLERELPESWE